MDINQETEIESSVMANTIEKAIVKEVQAQEWIYQHIIQAQSQDKLRMNYLAKLGFNNGSMLYKREIDLRKTASSNETSLQALQGVQKGFKEQNE